MLVLILCISNSQQALLDIISLKINYLWSKWNMADEKMLHTFHYEQIGFSKDL